MADLTDINVPPKNLGLRLKLKKKKKKKTGFGSGRSNEYKNNIFLSLAKSFNRIIHTIQNISTFFNMLLNHWLF